MVHNQCVPIHVVEHGGLELEQCPLVEQLKHKICINVNTSIPVLLAILRGHSNHV